MSSPCSRNRVGCFPIELLCCWVFRGRQQCLWLPIPYSWRRFGHCLAFSGQGAHLVMWRSMWLQKLKNVYGCWGSTLGLELRRKRNQPDEPLRALGACFLDFIISIVLRLGLYFFDNYGQLIFGLRFLTAPYFLPSKLSIFGQQLLSPRRWILL